MTIQLTWRPHCSSLECVYMCTDGGQNGAGLTTGPHHDQHSTCASAVATTPVCQWNLSEGSVPAHNGWVTHSYSHSSVSSLFHLTIYNTMFMQNIITVQLASPCKAIFWYEVSCECQSCFNMNIKCHLSNHVLMHISQQFKWFSLYGLHINYFLFDSTVYLCHIEQLNAVNLTSLEGLQSATMSLFMFSLEWPVECFCGSVRCD